MLLLNKMMSIEVSKRNLGFDPPTNVDRLSGIAALLQRELKQVKLQRAHGGCLGIERRRRT